MGNLPKEWDRIFADQMLLFVVVRDVLGEICIAIVLFALLMHWHGMGSWSCHRKL